MLSSSLRVTAVFQYASNQLRSCLVHIQNSGRSEYCIVIKGHTFTFCVTEELIKLGLIARQQVENPAIHRTKDQEVDPIQILSDCFTPERHKRSKQNGHYAATLYTGKKPSCHQTIGRSHYSNLLVSELATALSSKNFPFDLIYK